MSTIFDGMTLAAIALVILFAIGLVILFMFMVASSRSSRRKKLDASEQDVETLRCYATLVSDRKDGRHEPIRTADFWRVKPAMDPRLSNPWKD
jgi:hypothetical protein